MTETKTDTLSETSTVILSDQQDLLTDMPLIEDLAIPDHGISFYFPRLSRAIILPGYQDSFFIGRNMQEGSKDLMLDLEDLNGFAMGVSRRHALVRLIEREYEVVDLASRNGTWLYDQRLLPNKPYLLKDGSLLRIGQERLLVRYHSR